MRLEKLIIVGCMSNVVHAFTLRGKPSYSIYLPEPIACMELLSLSKTRTAKGLLIGLASGEIRLYNEKALIAQVCAAAACRGWQKGGHAPLQPP